MASTGSYPSGQSSEVGYAASLALASLSRWERGRALLPAVASDGLAVGCGDGDLAVGGAGYGVAGFLGQVVPWAGGGPVVLVGGPAPGCGSDVVDMTGRCRPVTARPVASIGLEFDAEPYQAGVEPGL